MLRATRVIARPSAAVARRFMTGGSVRSEGSVAQSSGWRQVTRLYCLFLVTSF